MSTFILAFFTSQSYSFWRSVYFTTRSIQGRINDICLLITASAKRSEGNGHNAYTGFSSEASNLVQTCTRLKRLSHTFFWASTPTCSNGLGDREIGEDGEHVDLHPSLLGESAIEIGPLLLSVEGLKSLEDADELTSNEVDSLLSCGLPPSQYTYVLLEWVSLYIIEGLQKGILHSGNGME